MLDVLHVCLFRAHVEELNKLIERALVALCFANDTAITFVLDPASYIEFVGFFGCGVAIAVSDT